MGKVGLSTPSNHSITYIHDEGNALHTWNGNLVFGTGPRSQLSASGASFSSSNAVAPTSMFIDDEAGGPSATPSPVKMPAPASADIVLKTGEHDGTCQK